MSNAKTPAAADWTQLLADPDFTAHVGELLKVYREAAPERREQALLEAMRSIKAKAGSSAPSAVAAPSSPENSPPFEPDIFTPSWGQDRRRYPRMKCFVAVELRLEGAATPVWGNLSNTSLGGCFVETATPVPTGVNAEIGLWVANGKLWVKGMILNGVVTRSSPCFGVRIKFSQMEPNGREVLRQFLKFVENTTKSYSSEQGYLAQLKR